MMVHAEKGVKKLKNTGGGYMEMKWDTEPVDGKKSYIWYKGHLNKSNKPEGMAKDCLNYKASGKSYHMYLGEFYDGKFHGYGRYISIKGWHYQGWWNMGK